MQSIQSPHGGEENATLIERNQQIQELNLPKICYNSRFAHKIQLEMMAVLLYEIVQLEHSSIRPGRN